MSVALATDNDLECKIFRLTRFRLSREKEDDKNAATGLLVGRIMTSQSLSF